MKYTAGGIFYLTIPLIEFVGKEVLLASVNNQLLLLTSSDRLPFFSSR